MSRVVILIELTCCAEEGVGAAQLRKEARYAELLEDINSTSWKASLLTVEIGARGLVGSRTYRSFINLGFSPSGSRSLCKRLSTVVARCSYAIYLAHKDVVWHHKSDLICLDDVPQTPTKLDDNPPREVATSTRVMHDTPPAVESKLPSAEPSTVLIPNVVSLQNHGFIALYHFTDAANLESIRENGLMSASDLESKCITSVMNSDHLSRALDKSKGLQDYVRLSFNTKNPMQFVAQKQKRISRAVMLEIKLEVVSRPGVLFADCNATRRDVITSTSPDVIRFEVVKAATQFDVEKELARFYQAEVLVPSPVPPELIIFPSDAALVLRKLCRPKIHINDHQKESVVRVDSAQKLIRAPKFMHLDPVAAEGEKPAVVVSNRGVKPVERAKPVITTVAQKIPVPVEKKPAKFEKKSVADAQLVPAAAKKKPVVVESKSIPAPVAAKKIPVPVDAAKKLPAPVATTKVLTTAKKIPVPVAYKIPVASAEIPVDVAPAKKIPAVMSVISAPTARPMCVKRPGEECSCGDTGCDGPPVFVPSIESESVCSSHDYFREKSLKLPLFLKSPFLPMPVYPKKIWRRIIPKIDRIIIEETKRKIF